jgi:hypothetical protein
MADAATIEEKAKQMGHVPKEEWKGDPDKWRPAEDFVERGENILPIMKKRLDEATKKIDAMSSDLSMTLKANKREVEEARKAAFEKATVEYNEKLKALDKKEMKAFKDEDEDAFKEAKKERAELKPPEAPKKSEPTGTTKARTPEFEAWNKKEPWYGKDSDLTKIANEEGTMLGSMYPDKTYNEIWDMTADRVKKLYPDKFENPRRKEPGAVEDGEGNTPKNGDKSFAALPKSAKDAYKRLAEQFKAKGREYKKEDYARDWHE